MHKGEWKGANVEKANKKVLILGESHYGNKNSTTEVMQTYLKNYNTCFGKDRDKSYRFFENIVKTFGYDPETQRDYFWSKVYFGNFVDEKCDVGDDKAKKAIKMNKDEYNRQLFEFIEKEKIDFIFCFSRKVYNNLAETKNGIDIENQISGSKRTRIEFCTYIDNLSKPVKVFGLAHTSRGYSPSSFKERIAEIVKSNCIF